MIHIYRGRLRNVVMRDEVAAKEHLRHVLAESSDHSTTVMPPDFILDITGLKVQAAGSVDARTLPFSRIFFSGQ